MSKTTDGAILPEDYDFLSNRQSTFEEQENMTVVPNYDAPTPEQLAVEDAAWDAITEKHKDTLGIISRLVLENAELRSRLSSVEQALAEALKEYEVGKIALEILWTFEPRTTERAIERARERIATYTAAAARSSSDQEGR